MAKVMICVPNAGNLRKETGEFLLQVVATKEKHEISISLLSGSPVDNVRNRQIYDFMQTDCEYLLFVDSDNPCTRNPLELVELDKDIVVCPTPFWRPTVFQQGMGANPMMWNVYDWEPKNNIWRMVNHRSGLHEIHAGGTGCMLIARRVLEAFYGTKDEPLPEPWFRRGWDEYGRADKGSDLLFCHRAREKGFEVWCHWDYVCRHVKSVDLLEVAQTMEWRDVKHAHHEDINTSSYWDTQWAKRGERQYPYYEWIVDQVGGQKVLDFGCGRGDLLEKLGDKACGYDISKEAVRVCEGRALSATHIFADVRHEEWEAVVCTQTLEHLEDDRYQLLDFFERTDRVIYAVPHDCLPPGLEREHRRTYTHEYCEQIQPKGTTQEIHEFGPYLVVDVRKAAVPAEVTT